MRDTDTLGGHTVDGHRQGLEELVEILLVDLGHVHVISVTRHHLREELEGIGDLNGIGAMCAQKQLGVVEGVKVIDRGAGAELDALDLLQVDKVHLLCTAGHAAVLDTGEGLLNGCPEGAGKEGGGGLVVHLVVTLLGGEVYHLAAVHQQHELVRVDVDDRTVGYVVLCSLFVVVSLVVLAHLHALTEDGGSTHIIGLKDLLPLVGKAASDGVERCFDDSHDRISFQIFRNKIEKARAKKTDARRLYGFVVDIPQGRVHS